MARNRANPDEGGVVTTARTDSPGQKALFG
jgi:hypothetical protein